jgi:hypothetical protein
VDAAWWACRGGAAAHGGLLRWSAPADVVSRSGPIWAWAGHGSVDLERGWRRGWRSSGGGWSHGGPPPLSPCGPAVEPVVADASLLRL